MKLFSLAIAALVAATAMPASAQMMMHRHDHGMMRSCHMEYRHHHRVRVCHMR